MVASSSSSSILLEQSGPMRKNDSDNSAFWSERAHQLRVIGSSDRINSSTQRIHQQHSIYRYCLNYQKKNTHASTYHSQLALFSSKFGTFSTTGPGCIYISTRWVKNEALLVFVLKTRGEKRRFRVFRVSRLEILNFATRETRTSPSKNRLVFTLFDKPILKLAVCVIFAFEQRE